MDITALTLKLIILLVPGILCAKIYKKLIIRPKESTDFMFVMYAIMFGIFSYLSLYMIKYIIHYVRFQLGYIEPMRFNALDAFGKISDGSTIPYSEVFYASIISIFISFLAVKVDNFKWINTIAAKLNISNKYGDENLFSRWLNGKCVEWVYVRDIENGLTYLGYVHSFAECEYNKELVLKQVSVMSYPESVDLYEVPEIYLCLKNENIKIELAINTQQNGEEQQSEPQGDNRDQAGTGEGEPDQTCTEH